METLYDLLGALPRDDAEELRAAFRQAVKGAHPDLNPNDPHAGQKFREIVRANEILGDEDQRAAYDHLLALAHKEQRQQTTVKVMHKAATSGIALVVAAGLGFGGYFVHAHSPEFAATLTHVADMILVKPGDFTGIAPPASAKTLPVPALVAKTEPPAPAEATAQASPVDRKVQIASVEPPPATGRKETATDMIVPIPVTPIVIAQPAEPDNAAPAQVGPPLEIAPSDPKVFRERGIFAYRSGDLDGAVAEFDRAIRLDPKFSAAYVDRSIVLYRMQKFERAFADIAQAKRLEKANRAAKTATAKKPKPPQATASLGFPLFQRRTANLAATTP